jgi:hypothetical protein
MRGAYTRGLFLPCLLACGGPQTRGTVDGGTEDASKPALACKPLVLGSDTVSVRVGYRSEPPFLNPMFNCWVDAFDGVVSFGVDGGGATLSRQRCDSNALEVYEGPITTEATAVIQKNLTQYCVVENPEPCNSNDGQYFELEVRSSSTIAKYFLGVPGSCSQFPSVRDARGPAGELIAYLKTLGTTTTQGGDAGIADIVDAAVE